MKNHFFFCSILLFMLLRASLWSENNFVRCGRNNMYNKEFCDFAKASHYRCRLCTWINKRGVWNKRRGWQNSPKLINEKCWIRLGRVAKNGIINKRGVPSIRNSRVTSKISQSINSMGILVIVITQIWALLFMEPRKNLVVQ